MHHVYIYAFIDIHVCKYVYKYMYIYVYLYVYLCMYVCMILFKICMYIYYSYVFCIKKIKKVQFIISAFISLTADATTRLLAVDWQQ
jgi:hypothetical protein